MIKDILLISLIFFLNGCEDKEIVAFSSCKTPIKLETIVCQNFLKNIGIKGLEYQGCKEGEGPPADYFEAIYFIKEENVVDVEKELIKKVNMQKFTDLNDMALTTDRVKSYFCIDNINVSLFIYLKNNPLKGFSSVDENNKDYKLKARVYSREI